MPVTVLAGSLLTPGGAQGPPGTGTNGDGTMPPLADATQDGLLRMVSGLATDYVGGDNQCHPLPEGGGGEGTQGPPGVNAYTSLASEFTIPAVGQTADVDMVDASWIVIGQMLAIEGAGSFRVTAKDVNRLTLLNPEISEGGGGGGIEEAPVDDKTYGRKNATWSEVSSGGGGEFLPLSGGAMTGTIGFGPSGLFDDSGYICFGTLNADGSGNINQEFFYTSMYGTQCYSPFAVGNYVNENCLTIHSGVDGAASRIDTTGDAGIEIASSVKMLMPLTASADPVNPLEVATKQYVDTKIGGGGGVNVQLFTTPGAFTWTIPAGAKWIEVTCIGGGGGGGSGASAPNNTAGGGGGGGAGGNLSSIEFAPWEGLTTIDGNVGVGGTGGAAKSGAGDGNAATYGGTSNFGSLCNASGGVGGGAGKADGMGGAGGTPNAVYGKLLGTQGGKGGDSGAVGGNAYAPNISNNGNAASGGGGGGSLGTSHTSVAGGSGGTLPPFIGGTNKAAGGIPSSSPSGSPGFNANPIGSEIAQPGSGGGGGTSGITGIVPDIKSIPVGSGGNGGLYGGGGGGGGANTDTNNVSGAGGNGGSGVVSIVSYL